MINPLTAWLCAGIYSLILAGSAVAAWRLMREDRNR